MTHRVQLPICHVAAVALANLLALGTAGALSAPQGARAHETAAVQRHAGHARARHAAHGAHGAHDASTRIARISPQAPARIDRSGRPRVGIASYYANYFAGREMADGARMNPRGSNAASRTLPLGTVARVTNLTTRRSAVVTIEDRGPYVRGRIVDLSPHTARKIGITRRIGIARVRVTPLAVPASGQRLRLVSAAHAAAGAPRAALR